MAPPAAGHRAERYRFDRFELQPAARRLLADGAEARLGARAFDVLLALVGHPGRVVTKDDLLATVWPGVVVEEANLAVQISALRKVLGPGLISTVAGRGYQFTGSLEPLAAAPEPAAAGAVVDAAARGVPQAAAPIIGREAELATLAGLLSTHRMVTVAGAGGIGKTRLAMAWCEGPGLGRPLVWMDLAAVADASRLASSVLARLQAAVGAGAASPPGAAEARAGTALAQLCQTVAQRPLMLVLDNAEQVAGELAVLAQAMLDAAPRLCLLVTSQVPVRLGAEQVFRLGTLPVPPARATPAQALEHAAVVLFVERARAADPQFELAPGNVTSVVELCRRLDGLPLALELAASRVATIGVNALAAALGAALDAAGASGDEAAAARSAPGAGLGVLGEGPRDAPARQRTLSAALEWSHALLDAPARRVFRRLGVFAGGFTLAAAQAVVGDEDEAPAAIREAAGGADAAVRLDAWTVLGTIGRLVEHSLVTKDGAEPPRFSLLESSRLFALEQLERAREAADRRARHLAWCLAHVREVAASSPRGPAGAGLGEGPLGDAAAARITVEYANLRVALEHALAPGSAQREAGAALAVALLPYWRHIDAPDEQRRWTAAAPDDATAQRLLERLRTDGVLAEGRPAGLEAAAVMALARRVSVDEVASYEQALVALERAVSLAAEVLGRGRDVAPARAGSAGLDAPAEAHADAYVDAVLEASQRHARGGDFDRGVELIDRALVEVERRDAEQRQRWQRARQALLQAALAHDLERRDAPAAARRIEALGALQQPGRPTAAAFFREREAGFLAEGLDPGHADPSLALAVAEQLLRRRLQAAPAGDGGAEARREAGLALARVLNRRVQRDSQGAATDEAQRVCRDALAETEPATQPALWAALQHELARALVREGERAGNARLVDEALACCRRALQVRTREQAPSEWIDSMSLLAQLERIAGMLSTDTAHLQAAIDAGRECLRWLPRESSGRQWAALQSTIGLTLSGWARRTGGPQRRHEAVAAFRAALGELSLERTPNEWASTQCNLAIELAALGEAEAGAAGMEWLQAAVDAYRAALQVWSLKSSPARCAIVQHNLGGALRLLGERETGTQSLREAALAFAEAQKQHTRERAPGHWAASENDRALALLALGRRENRPELIEQAAAALRAALQVRDRAASPFDWANTQMSLAEVLATLAQMTDDPAPMQAAAQAAEAALQELTAGNAPADHARGVALAAEARAWLAHPR